MDALLPISLFVFFQAPGLPPPGLQSVIDNARVTVWDVSWTSGKPPQAEHREYDMVSICLNGGTGVNKAIRPLGDAIYIPKNAPFPEEAPVPGKPARSILIAVKNGGEPPLANKSGYPNAFPRPGVKKLFENNKVIIWDYSWTPGVPTPTHFHDKEVVVVYLDNGPLKSTTPDGQSVVNEYKFGMARFNPPNRIHTEEVIRGAQHAVMTEFK